MTPIDIRPSLYVTQVQLWSAAKFCCCNLCRLGRDRKHMLIMILSYLVDDCMCVRQWQMNT